MTIYANYTTTSAYSAGVSDVVETIPAGYRPFDTFYGFLRNGAFKQTRVRFSANGTLGWSSEAAIPAGTDLYMSTSWLTANAWPS